VYNPLRSDLINLLTVSDVSTGHTRYSTHGSSDEVHCQPFIKEMIHGWFAVAHNGQLVNASKLKKEVRNFTDLFAVLYKLIYCCIL